MCSSDREWLLTFFLSHKNHYEDYVSLEELVRLIDEWLSYRHPNSGDVMTHLLCYMYQQHGGEWIDYFVSRGASMEGGDQLFLSFWSFEELEELHRYCPDVNVANQYGQTALMKAAFCSFDECTEWLLDRGARTDMRNFRGQTALMLFVAGRFESEYEEEKEKEEMLLRRLSAGGVVHIRDQEGKTVLSYADNQWWRKKLKGMGARGNESFSQELSGGWSPVRGDDVVKLIGPHDVKDVLRTILMSREIPTLQCLAARVCLGMCPIPRHLLDHVLCHEAAQHVSVDSVGNRVIRWIGQRRQTTI